MAVSQIVTLQFFAATPDFGLSAILRQALRLVALAWCLSLASCYIDSISEYRGPDMLPGGPGSTKGRVPAHYQIKILPDIPMVMNREVAEQHRVMSGQPRTFKEAFERREPYHSVLRQILQDEGVPESLLSLALVESGFRRDARSPYGAVGIWQFIKSTAVSYGLEVGFLSDQRKDPVLSTIAAARMLRDLYERFGDWLLAIAAYNSGPARIERAIKAAGSRDFWQLARSGHLPNETKKFVPRVLAAAMIEREQVFMMG